MVGIDTVLFDLDGTLIDTIDDLSWTCEKVLSEWGRGREDGTPVYDRETYHHFVGNGIRKLVERAFGGTLTEQELDAATGRFLELYDAHLDVKTAPYEGIIETLDALKAKGIRMGIVTNKPEAQARRLAEKFFSGYDMYCVYGSVAGRPNKPDPCVVKIALNDCGSVEEHTVFVGDSDVDVVTAHNAALPCCGASWGFRGAKELKDAGAEVVLDKPTDLLAALGL